MNYTPFPAYPEGSDDGVLYEGRRNLRSMIRDYLMMLPILGALVALEFAQASSHGGLNLLIVIGIPVGFLFDLLIISYIRRITTNYKITDREIFARSEFGLKKSYVTLDAVEEVELKQSKFDRKLGVGTVLIKTHNQPKPIRFTGVRNPEDVVSIANEVTKSFTTQQIR